MKYSFISLMAWVTALLLVATPVAAAIFIDGSGGVVVQQGQVLSSGSGSDGDDDNSGSGSSSDESDDDSSGSSGSGSSGSDDDPIYYHEDNSGSGSGDDKTETRSEDGTRTETEIRDDGEVRTEVRLPGGIRVKTRIEDGRSRTDVYQGGIKVRFEREGDRFRITVEDATGQETEVGEDDILIIDERVDRNQIKIRTFSTAGDLARNRAIIERLNTQALTDLPLSVNLETNELTVTTQAGERTVTVLPDQAVQNMLAANVIDRIGGQELVNLVRQGGIEALDQVIILSEQRGVPIYEVQGVKNHRLLGFIPVTTDVTVTMSAETGEILDIDQSFLDTIVDVFSTSV